MIFNFFLFLSSVGLLGAGGVIMGRCTANPAPPSTAGRPLTGIKFQFARPTPRHPPTSPIQQPSTNLTTFHSFLHDKWRQNNCQEVKESQVVFGDQFEDNNHYWLNHFSYEWLKKLFFTILYWVKKIVNIVIYSTVLSRENSKYFHAWCTSHTLHPTDGFWLDNCISVSPPPTPPFPPRAAARQPGEAAEPPCCSDVFDKSAAPLNTAPSNTAHLNTVPLDTAQSNQNIS